MLAALADYRCPASPARRARVRRHRVFLRLMDRLPRPARILDVGGTEDYWRVLGLPAGVKVVALNLGGGTSSTPGVELVRGDARDLSRFGDRSFDVVFSNSLIEHVGPPPDMERCAAEIRRVGRAYFVQTPNRWFPVEPHFLLPFLQWLPLAARARLVALAGWTAGSCGGGLAEARRLVEGVRLLDRRTLAHLFPGATIWKERWLGLAKSLVAYSGFGPPGAPDPSGGRLEPGRGRV